MLARIVSAAVLIPAVLALIWLAPRPLFVLAVGAVGTICMHEYLRLTAGFGARGAPWFAHAGFWVVLLALGQARLQPAAVLALVVAAGFTAGLCRRAPMQERVWGAIAGLAGVFYLALCLLPAVLLRFDLPQQNGRAWLVIMLATIWAGDTAAFAIGGRFGRMPLAPVVSPRKTVEGAAAGLIGGTAAAIALNLLLFPRLPPGHTAAAALVVGCFGQLGDLSESMLKRAAGVKDSSGLIPGHGGLLDRIDSVLFALPALYGYLLWLGPR